ncbi:MAG: hypothetical protein HY521_00735 [Proteobacteria bacterium]|nr:hypothetical protein [Pseudomonadota bacterium]
MEARPRRDIRTHVASGRERLERLAALVETLPPATFTLSRWYGQGRGCAVGWAAAGDPWFQAQGLRLEGDGSLKDCRPVYGEKTDWQAVQGFFDLSFEDVARLFVPAAYDGEMQPHPRRMATRIRRFLAASRAAPADLPASA